MMTSIRNYKDLSQQARGHIPQDIYSKDHGKQSRTQIHDHNLTWINSLEIILSGTIQSQESELPSQNDPSHPINPTCEMNSQDWIPRTSNVLQQVRQQNLDHFLLQKKTHEMVATEVDSGPSGNDNMNVAVQAEQKQGLTTLGT